MTSCETCNGLGRVECLKCKGKGNGIVELPSRTIVLPICSECADVMYIPCPSCGVQDDGDGFKYVRLWEAVHGKPIGPFPDKHTW